MVYHTKDVRKPLKSFKVRFSQENRLILILINTSENNDPKITNERVHLPGELPSDEAAKIVHEIKDQYLFIIISIIYYLFNS